MPELHTGSSISHTPSSDHSDLSGQRAHPSGDPLLGVLMAIPGAVGDLVRAFPGRQREADLRWLDEWFRHRTEEWYGGGDGAQITPVPSATIADADRTLSDGDGARLCPIRLLTVEPHYFRGFRTLSSPVEFRSRPSCSRRAQYLGEDKPCRSVRVAIHWSVISQVPPRARHCPRTRGLHRQLFPTPGRAIVG